MKAPFFKIYINGDVKKDISEFVEGFSYEDSCDEDSLLTLSIKDQYALNLSDDGDIVSGSMVIFKFGYLGGEISEVQQARITDINYRYRDSITVTVKCLGVGTTVRKIGTQKIWKNKTSTQIAKEIAGKYNLSAEVDETTFVWDNLPQGNKSDFSLLRYLASREETGNYITYIRNSVLYFVQRGTSKESLMTFTYGDGSDVISFEPKVKESSQNMESSGVSIPVVNTDDNELEDVEVDSDNEEQTGTLGHSKYVYNSAGNLMDNKRKLVYGGGNINTNAPLKPATKPEPKVNTTPVDSKKEAVNVANNSKKTSSMESMVGTLVVEGRPLLTPNNIITISGVAKQHSGNWFIHNIKHSISQSGYTSRLELKKNGTNRGMTTKKTSITEKASDSNNSVGTDEVEDKKSISTYDSTGSLMTTKQKIVSGSIWNRENKAPLK